MLERDIQNPSVDKARRQGWYCRKFRTEHRRSAPDYLFAKEGYLGEHRIFFIEFKATGEKPTILQEEEHAAMRSAGLIVYVCDSRELFAEIMRHESKRIDEEWA